jgi:hypothetical protein
LAVRRSNHFGSFSGVCMVWIGLMPYLGVDISHSFLSFSM